MKKAYIIISLLGVLVLAGCSVKAPKISVPDWDIQTSTGVEFTGMTITGDNTMEEFTWMIDTQDLTVGSVDSWVMPTIVDTKTAAQTWAVEEVKGLITERQSQSKDSTKLTEEDIDLMEQIIQKIQNLGN